jgi:chromate transporter
LQAARRPRTDIPGGPAKVDEPIEQSLIATTATPPAPSLFEIFVGFSKAGLCAVGGGLSGWMMREFVQNRGWLTEREFLSGLALAQAFPGVNVVNLSIWIGFQLRGGRGALSAALGMIVIPMFVAIGVISAFDQIAHYRLASVLLAGAAAAAIGLSLSMGVRAVRSSAVHIAPALVIVATVVALFVLQWPLLPVLVVVAPISIAQAFWRLRTGGTRS